MHLRGGSTVPETCDSHTHTAPLWSGATSTQDHCSLLGLHSEQQEVIGTLPLGVAVSRVTPLQDPDPARRWLSSTGAHPRGATLRLQGGSSLTKLES